MIENFKGKSEDEVKVTIESLSPSDLQELIKEGQNKYQQLTQQKSAVEAEIKVNQEAYETEMNKLKELGINSLDELHKAIEDERNSINNDLINLVKIINEVE